MGSIQLQRQSATARALPSSPSRPSCPPLVCAGTRQVQLMFLDGFPHIAELVCDSPWAPGAFGADKRAADAVAGVLLAATAALPVMLQLPEDRRLPGASWKLAAVVASALTTPALTPSVWSAGASAATASVWAAALAGAARLLAEAPQDVPPKWLAEVAPLLAQLSRAWASLDSRQQQQRSAQQLARAVARLPAVMRATQGSRQHWCCEALSLMAPALAAYLRGGPCQGTAELADWCRTAAALLQAVPLMAELWPVLHARQARFAVQAAALVVRGQGEASNCLEHALQLAAAAAANSLDMAADGVEPSAALEHARWQLHTAACRAAAWMGSGGAAVLPPSDVPHLAEWLLACASSALLHGLTERVLAIGPRRPSRCARALTCCCRGRGLLQGV